MKRFILFLGSALAAVSGAKAQNEAPCNCYALEGEITSNTTLDANKCYLIKGCVTVASGARLTIPAGTVLYGRRGDGSLVIERGAQIDAQGTSSDPIVFTSDQPDSSRQPGDWKGISIGGYAVNNIGGGSLTLERVCGNLTGGGISDADNSGVMKYVQILYAGGGNVNEQEVNGLTLNSVGSGTTLEHIQVAYSGRDGIAFLGGTVDAKYLVANENRINDFTTKFGYRGRIQYGLSVRMNVNAHDNLGSNGLLSMNDSSASSNIPVTRPVFSNFSFLGGGYCDKGQHIDFKNAVLFTGNTEARIYNSVLSGWPTGFYIGDLATIKNANDHSSLFFAYNTFYKNATDHDHSGSWTAAGCEANMDDWINSGTSNPLSCMLGNEIFSSALGYSDLLCSDFCCFVPSFAIGTTDLDYPNFSYADLQAGFFDEAIYRGGIQSTDWTSGWTDWCTQGKEYCSAKKAFVPQETRLALQPNPALNISYAVFDAHQKGRLEVLVLDKISGKVLRKVTSSVESPGSQKIAVPLEGIREGIYMVQVRLADGSVLSAPLLVK